MNWPTPCPSGRSCNDEIPPAGSRLNNNPWWQEGGSSRRGTAMMLAELEADLRLEELISAINRKTTAQQKGGGPCLDLLARRDFPQGLLVHLSCFLLKSASALASPPLLSGEIRLEQLSMSASCKSRWTRCPERCGSWRDHPREWTTELL